MLRLTRERTISGRGGGGELSRVGSSAVERAIFMAARVYTYVSVLISRVLQTGEGANVPPFK